MGSMLKNLSGKDILKILSKFGFVVYDQTGSHIKLRRAVLNVNQTLVIPNHKNIAKGTIKAIFNQSSKYISESELFPFFYNN